MELAAAAYIFLHYVIKKNRKNRDDGGKHNFIRVGTFVVVKI